MLEARDAYPVLQVYLGSVSCKIAGQHSLNYPPSFLFRDLKRLVRLEVLYISIQEVASGVQGVRAVSGKKHIVHFPQIHGQFILGSG